MAQLMVVNKETLLEEKIMGLRELKCTNGRSHKVRVVRYGDGSIWVFCPYFGYVGPELKCKVRKNRCRYFKAT